jgi:AraC-like DNA-binding protein
MPGPQSERKPHRNPSTNSSTPPRLTIPPGTRYIWPDHFVQFWVYVPLMSCRFLRFRTLSPNGMAVRYHPLTMAAPFQIAEWSKFYRYDDRGEVSALHARFVTHRYPRHSHDYFVVGLVESGAQSYTYKGARHVTPAGSIFVVNPDEIHTGEAASEDGYVYRTLCLSVSFVADSTCELGTAPQNPFLRGAVLADHELLIALRRFHQSLSGRHPRMESDALLCEATSLLFGRYGDTPQRPVRPERSAIVRAREYIEETFAQDISLAGLSKLCLMSPFFFARTFAIDTGLPPHAYLDGVRLRHARRLLDQGEPIASVAISVGYADQSHLTKRFKRLFGITPGQYRSQK